MAQPRSRFPSYPMNIDRELELYLRALQRELEYSLTERLVVEEVVTGGDVTVEKVDPAFVYKESDQALPAGLWRTRVEADAWSLEKNTAAAGDFSTKITALGATATQLTVPTLALILGAVTSAPTAGGLFAVQTGLHVGSSYTAPPVGGLRTEGGVVVEAGGINVTGTSTFNGAAVSMGALKALTDSTTSNAQFGTVPWGLRIAAEQSGRQWLSLGVEKTAADNLYKAQTGNNTSVHHLVLRFNYDLLPTAFEFLSQSHQVDGTTLSLTGASVSMGALTASSARLSSTDPFVIQDRTGSALNEKKWRTLLTATQLQADVLNDAESANDAWLIVTRSGATISSVSFNNKSVSMGPLTATAGTFSGVLRASDKIEADRIDDLAITNTFYQKIASDVYIGFLVGNKLRFRGGATVRMDLSETALTPATAGLLTLGTDPASGGLPWGSIFTQGEVNISSANPGVFFRETDSVDSDWSFQVNGGQMIWFQVNDARSVFTERLRLSDSQLRVGTGLVINFDASDGIFQRAGATKLTLASASATFADIGIFPASTTSAASARLPHGSAPTTPTDGDVWTTTGSMFVRINGATLNLGQASDPLRLSDGSASAPAYSFASDTDQGWYADSASPFLSPTMALSVGGSRTVGIQNGALWLFLAAASNYTLRARVDSNTAGNTLLSFLADGKNSGGAYHDYVWLDFRIKTATAGSTDGRLVVRSRVAGTLTDIVTMEAGIQVGAPTGGDKGSGTINVAGDIYKNNSAYNNPDYVFELAYLGRALSPLRKGYQRYSPLADVEAYTREHYHLPGMDRSLGLFGATGVIEEKVEESYLYLFDHERRLVALEEARTP